MGGAGASALKSLSAAVLAAFAWAPALAGEPSVLTDLAWTDAPSFAEVAAAYPAQARARGQSGEAILNCTLNAQGRLSVCSTISQTAGGEFAKAARSLTGRFQGPTARPDGRGIGGVRAQIAFRFTPDLLETWTVSRPEWTAMPPAQAFQAAFPEAASKAGVLKARAAMTCTVSAGGLLGDCEAASEDPPGYGFAAATLPLAPAFRVRAWGADGRPVIGGKVRVPIRYELEQAPAAKP